MCLTPPLWSSSATFLYWLEPVAVSAPLGDRGNEDTFLGIFYLIRSGVTDDTVDRTSVFGWIRDSLAVAVRWENLAGDHVVSPHLDISFGELHAFREQIASIALESVTTDRGLRVLDTEVVDEAGGSDSVDPSEDNLAISTFFWATFSMILHSGASQSLKKPTKIGVRSSV